MKHEKLTFLGRKHTEEHKKHMSDILRGVKKTIETRKKLSDMKKMSGSWSGENNPNWRGGVHKENWLGRSNADSIRWRRQVLKNNGRKCGKCGKDLNGLCKCCGQKIRTYVHHIKPFRDFPDCRYSIENGIVLCESCHDKVENLANSVEPRTGNAEPNPDMGKCVETIYETVRNN